MKSRIQSLFSESNTYLSVIAFILLLAVCIPATSTRINDADFWWHLNTGEWILDNKQIPETDPFSHTYRPGGIDEMQWAGGVMRTFWFCQVLFHLIYTYAGFAGIIFLRASIFAVILFILYLRLSRSTIIRTLWFWAGLLFVIMASEFVFTRPKIFSYLFAFLLLHMLDTVRDRIPGKGNTLKIDLKKLWWMPFVMLLWSNMHGGFILGIVIIGIYAVCDAVYAVRRKGEGIIKWKWLFLIYAVSVVASFINANSYHTLMQFFQFQGSLIQSESFEYLSPLKAVPFLGINWLVYVVLLFISAGTILAKRGKMAVEHILLILLTAVMSLSSIRYVIYFIMFAVSLIPLYVSEPISTRVPDKYQRMLLVAGMCLALFMIVKSPNILKEIRLGYNIDTFPREAVNFIKEKNITGKMFNDAEWGGYIAFRLYPDQKIFMDTRTLDPEVYNLYLTVLRADSTPIMGTPMWKGIIDMYEVNYVIHARMNWYTKEMFPLIYTLMRDKEWQLVYSDKRAMIFLRQ